MTKKERKNNNFYTVSLESAVTEWHGNKASVRPCFHVMTAGHGNETKRSVNHWPFFHAPHERWNLMARRLNSYGSYSFLALSLADVFQVLTSRTTKLKRRNTKKNYIYSKRKTGESRAMLFILLASLLFRAWLEPWNRLPSYSLGYLVDVSFLWHHDISFHICPVPKLRW